MREKTYMIPNPPTPNRVLNFNIEKCTGCNRCVEVCPNDVLMPNPQKKQPPVILYQDECWYCGGCVEECPQKGAIALLHPLQQRISVNWKNVATGEYRGLVMKNPPPPNTRPPVGGWNINPPKNPKE